MYLCRTNYLLTMMEKQIIDLFQVHFGIVPERVELLPASGSARKYFRIFHGKESYMGTWNQDVAENRLFLRFTRHFVSKGLHVPQIYAIGENELTYIQEDLGNWMLLDVVESERRERSLSSRVMTLYQKALKELVRFQLYGHEGMDYEGALPRPVFDQRCILWDLNYFKYCFLRLTGATFSEDALENDFEQLVLRLDQVDRHFFMFRDFQSRNIMVREDEVWFIDYQGGRQGALQYDVASLLYDAIVEIPDEQRESLLTFYIKELQAKYSIEAEKFRQDYYHFVLIRLLQAMGAFGLRGLYERKQHFIDSIVPGLHTISHLFESGRLGGDYPEIRQIVRELLLRY